MSENSWLALLLANLRARGVTFVMKGNALKVRPWKTLTKDEASTVQANRAALKDLVRAESLQEVPPQRTTPPPEHPQPAPVPCKWCGRHPCIGESHEAYYTLHPEAAQAREHARQNREFRLMTGLDPWPR
jgi:hypothetical protein